VGFVKSKFQRALFQRFGGLNPAAETATTGDPIGLNVYSQVARVGLSTPVGLVSKYSILIVEFANQLQVKGLSKLMAVLQAATIRLRPILMTSAATFLAVVKAFAAPASEDQMRADFSFRFLAEDVLLLSLLN
jgi:multidrug efflux pump subunit AcrB